jgi:hypothetical protein
LSIDYRFVSSGNNHNRNEEAYLSRSSPCLNIFLLTGEKTGPESSKRVLATIPKRTKLIIERAESISILKTTYGGLTGYIPTYKVKFENPDSYDILKNELFARVQAAAQLE